MSRYSVRPLSLAGFRTGPLAERESKVSAREAGTPMAEGAGLAGFLGSIPRILAGKEIRELAVCMRRARQLGKPVVMGFGGHLPKCGLGAVVADLLRRGIVTALATNGSGAIHDAELALVGHTSEDVARRLREGTFGTARETQALVAGAARRAVAEGIGLGEALGAVLSSMAPAHPEQSLLLAAYERRVPVTVHVAIGTDTVHLAPELDPAALGAATHHDLRLLSAIVGEMNGGGVYLNVGSAVILPEVFLKAVTVVRNLGGSLDGLVTANFDFIQHYRPRENVLHRPTQDGGRSFALTGHHEIMVPLLAALLIEPEP